MNNPTTLEEMARQAIDGDREALEGLVRVLQAAEGYFKDLRIISSIHPAQGGAS